MHELPASISALCGVAFLLGARHGLDADHLVTIDGMTRLNALARPRVARLAGTLFSLGHCAVVVAVALATAVLAERWHTPAWLEVSGTLVSLAFLLALGVLNARALMHSAPDTIVSMRGLKARTWSKVLRARHPLAIAGVGALFAISFDTVSLAALFGVAAVRLGGAPDVVLAAALFTLGMVAVDGVNGWWISRIVRRADRTAARASRVLACAVALLSFGVAGVAGARLLAPGFDHWMDDRDLALTVAVFVTLVVALLAGPRLTRRAHAPSAD